MRMNKRILWYISRTRAMSFSELLWRINSKVHARLQKFFLFFFGSPLDRKQWVSRENKFLSDEGYFLGLLRKLVIGEIEDNVSELYDELFPEGKKDIIKKAGRILQHRFNFLGCNNVYFGKKINWHLDCKTGKGWPEKFWDDIDIKSLETLDIKYVWELNRHQHLPILGIAYFLTREEKYVEEICYQLKDWMGQNPPYYGVNWISPLELSIRIISWIVALSFIADSQNLEKKLLLDIMKYIFLQAEFIDLYHSRYSSANNHLIGEATGLFISGIVLKDYKKAARWVKRGYRILIEEIEKQTYSDGVNKEQAISYQCFVLDFFLLAGLLGRKAEIEFPDKYWQSLKRMIEFLFSVIDCKGNVPNVGDSDDGYVIKLSGDENFNNYRSLLATGAVLFNREDFKYKALNFDEKSFWLLGQEGKRKFDNLPVKNESITSFFESRAFPAGGYYILRSGQDKNEVVMAFDCGALGYLSIAAHGHSDALSFTLNVGGNPVFIDPGTYAYHSDREWREYFRGTSAHNTIRIDEEDQSIIGGPFLWEKKAKAYIEDWKFTDKYDVIKGYHDGYSRFKDPVIHERKIFFDKLKEVFIIEDFLKSKHKHLLEQFFHLDEKCKIEKLAKNFLEIKRNGYYCYLLNGSDNLEYDLLKGNSHPMLGWQSKRFGVKNPAWSVRCKVNFRGKVKLLTFIFVSRERKKLESILRRKEEVLITRTKMQY